MSHFTVLVAAKDESELNDRLDPFYEQYGPEDERAQRKGWVVFKPISELRVEEPEWYDYDKKMTDAFELADGRVVEKYSKEFEVKAEPTKDNPFPRTQFIPPENARVVEVPISTFMTEDEFYKDYHGLVMHNGEFGYWHNPNSKWDWWSVGGRWTGALPLISENGHRPEGAYDGTPGVFGKVNDDPFYADTALVKDINFDKWKGEDYESYAKKWDLVHAALDSVADINSLPELYELYYETTIKKFKAYEYDPYKWIGETILQYTDLDRQEGIDKCWPDLISYARWQVAERLVEVENDYFFFMTSFDDIHAILQPREEYLAGKDKLAQTFAFIDTEGRWNERGSMGWWGIVSDKQEDYDATWWAFVESLDEDQRLYVVDCHI